MAVITGAASAWTVDAKELLSRPTRPRPMVEYTKVTGLVPPEPEQGAQAQTTWESSSAGRA
ncbi:MAG: hypothetical protein ACLT9P_07750 [Evtepia gabavorous]